MKKQILTILCLSLGISFSTWAEEESLNLDEIKVPQTQVIREKPRTTLMGRVDLTSEVGGYAENDPRPENELKNNHFLIFLKANPSARTSFMGEIAGRSFFSVQLKMDETSFFEFGKIQVPFGDTRSFHHFYGGIQGYGVNGVMFKNVWAESGFNFHKQFGKVESDFYVVNSVAADDAASEVDLQSTSDKHQAVGVRMSQSIGLNSGDVTYFVSAYHGDYFQGRPVDIFGGDLDFGYGALGLKILKVKLGVAQALVKKSPGFSDYKKTGDYLQTSWQLANEQEIRVRYGTYIDNDQFKSNRDGHNFNLGYSFGVDVVRFLVEKQWNFEAINEVDNDLYRLMASLDF